MSNKRGPLIAAGAGLLVILLMVVGLILPKASAVREKQNEVQRARQEGSTLELQVQQLEAAAKRAGKSRRRLAALEAQVPPTADLPSLIRLLNRTAAEADLDFVALAPGQPTPTVSGSMSAVPVQVTVVGRFFAVEHYLLLLEELPRISRILSLNVVPGPDNLPQLQVSASMEFYTTDLSAGPGSVPGSTAAQPVAPQGPQASSESESATSPSLSAGA
jgi:Tfp pilus assembly protein PilO